MLLKYACENNKIKLIVLLYRISILYERPINFCVNDYYLFKNAHSIKQLKILNEMKSGIFNYHSYKFLLDFEKIIGVLSNKML